MGTARVRAAPGLWITFRKGYTMNGEAVIYVGPASQWQNAGVFVAGAVGLLVVGLVWLGFAASVDGDARLGVNLAGWAFTAGILLWLLRAWWGVRFKVYRVGTARVEIERGLVSKRIEHVELWRVVDVRLEIGLIERLCGIGTVALLTSDKSAPALKLAGIPRPRAVYDALKVEIQRADQRGRVLRVEG